MQESKSSCVRKITTVFRGTKSKLLLSSAVISNFAYCPLIWLLCSKGANYEINRTCKRALRVSFGDYESTFEEVLEKNRSKTEEPDNI